MGQHLELQPYAPGGTQSDHDHCEFCGAKFSLRGDALRAGYAPVDRYHWVCPECYADFKSSFGWT